MFRGFRRQNYGRSGGSSGFGLMLLALQVMQVGLDNIPIITLITLGINVAVFLELPPHFIISVSKACVSFVQVWYMGEWSRILFAPWFHSHDFHLYYNMSSLIWKGRKLERGLGSLRFAIVIVLFALLTSSLTVLLSFLFSEVLEDSSYMNQCAVGFSGSSLLFATVVCCQIVAGIQLLIGNLSLIPPKGFKTLDIFCQNGVLFALKVLLSYYEPGGMVSIMFLRVPASFAFWVELFLIQVLVPNVSFVGHLSGILVGLAYVKGPLRFLVDTIVKIAQILPDLSDSDTWERRQRQRYNWQGTAGAPRGNTGPETRNHWQNQYTNGMNEDDQIRWATEQSREQNTGAYQRTSTRFYPNLEPPSAPSQDQLPDNSPPIGFVVPDRNQNGAPNPDIGFLRQQRLNRFG